jgi:hypothetical protein
MSKWYVEDRISQFHGGVVDKPSRHSHPMPPKYPAGTVAKPCSGCGTVKPLEAFGLHKLGALGRSAKCKECLQVIAKGYHRRKVEALAGRARSNTCECCGAPASGARALHMDHDHATGAFRGWLCHGCNTALGNTGEDVARLRALLAYLERHRPG